MQIFALQLSSHGNSPRLVFHAPRTAHALPRRIARDMGKALHHDLFCRPLKTRYYAYNIKRNYSYFQYAEYRWNFQAIFETNFYRVAKIFFKQLFSQLVRSKQFHVKGIKLYLMEVQVLNRLDKKQCKAQTQGAQFGSQQLSSRCCY